MTTGMAVWVKRHPLTGYFTLAFLITWVLVAPLAAASLGLLPYALSPHWHFLGALGPVLATGIVTAATQGRSGLVEFAGRMRRWRVGTAWLAIAGLSTVLLFVLSAVVLRLAGYPWPEFGRLTSGGLASFGWVFGSLLSALAFGIGEEAGWRGFALLRLQHRYGAFAATLGLSVFWALWRAPMFFYRFEFGPGQAVGFFIGLSAGAVWLTSLYNSCGGSVFATAVWHSV